MARSKILKGVASLFKRKGKDVVEQTEGAPARIFTENIVNEFGEKEVKEVFRILDDRYKDPNIDVIGYYHNKKLVAFSLMRHIYKDKKNIEAYQFAWDYENPELKLGLKSLENECALYKSKGYRYIYLGEANHYKTKFDGFEILGPVD